MLKPMEGAPASVGAPIGRFHDAGTAAGRDDIPPRSAMVKLGAAAVGNDAAELAGRLIPAPPVAFADARRSQDDDRRCHPPFAQIFFRLLIFEMEADPARRIAEEKVLVENRQPVGSRQPVGQSWIS